MAIKKKISDLPESTDFTGLYTIGVNALNKSVKVSLEYIATMISNLVASVNSVITSATSATNSANSAAASANSSATSANIATDNAKAATANANSAAEEANTATDNANAATANANSAAEEANTATDNANAATANANSAAEAAMGITEECRELYEEIKVFDERKADIDGQYDTLTAGNAQNLIGRGEATSEEFTFRPSGDISIQDGTARITKLKGNTVVWNQFMQNGRIGTLSGLTASYDPNTHISTINGTATADLTMYGTGGVFTELTSRSFCKRLTHVSGTVTSSRNVIVYGGTAFPNNENSVVYVLDGVVTDYEYLLFRANKGDVFDNYQFRVECFDLLKMFCSVDAIPPTYEDFVSLFPDSYYPYNAGELKSLTATGIKSVGFNAWDEEWELGGIYPSDGNNFPTSTSIRSKNYIPVVQNQQYYVKGSFPMIVVGYDSNYEYVTYLLYSAPNKTISIPSGISYIKWCSFNEDVTTYQNDICINLSNTGYRNGEYKPYVDFTRQLPIQEIKDAEGNLLFPDGLCSAGTVYDEITEKKAIKRIGKVDLGTLTWYKFSGTIGYYTYSLEGKIKQPESASTAVNAICTNYTRNTYTNADYGVDKIISGTWESASIKYIRINNSSYSDAASLKASLSGVYLYYELATPIEVDLEQEVNMDYEVWDFGTEEMITEGFSTPIKADIIYGFNAVDRIRENTLSIEDLITRVAQLESQLTSLTNNNN